MFKTVYADEFLHISLLANSLDVLILTNKQCLTVTRPKIPKIMNF